MFSLAKKDDCLYNTLDGIAKMFSKVATYSLIIQRNAKFANIETQDTMHKVS